MTRYVVAVAALTVVGATHLCHAQQATAAAPVARPENCATDRAAPADHATMDHAAHQAALEKCATGPIPTAPGQAAFGAISEIVRLLKADPTTDWTKVNIEALRQHLIDMNEVTMNAAVVQRNVPGGIEVDVTGAGRTMEAIRRMAINHSSVLDAGGDYRASARETAGGAHLTITAKDANDASVVARIRGLGFAGLMTEGDHHAAHHLALAKGQPIHSR